MKTGDKSVSHSSSCEEHFLPLVFVQHASSEYGSASCTLRNPRAELQALLILALINQHHSFRNEMQMWRNLISR